jgi:hypothetical protein
VATEGECRELVKRVKEVVGEVGGRENKAMEGKVGGGVVTIYCEGRVVKKEDGKEGVQEKEEVQEKGGVQEKEDALEEETPEKLGAVSGASN